MRRFIYTIVVVSVVFLLTSAYSQGLGTNAATIKNMFPEEYENIFKKYAVEKWGTDHEMILYQINNQADALVELIDEFNPDYSAIAIKAISSWSHDEYEKSNSEKLDSITIFNIESLIGLGCDWEMVKYEYDNQVEANQTLNDDEPEGYNSQATELHQKLSDDFSATIKQYAKEEWKDDFEMIVYEINNQSKALFDLTAKFENSNTEILISSIQKWGIKSFSKQNSIVLKNLTAFELSQLIKLHCDWTMVEYEYDNQVKAKNSY